MIPLHLRLLAVLLAILVPGGVLFGAASVGAARAYHAEVTQRQSVDLARNLLAEEGAEADAGLSDAALDGLVKMLAMANPGVEIYVLDPDGRVVQAPVTGELEVDRVDPADVARFLDVAARGRGFPVYGADPRRGGRTVFSAADLGNDRGSLYVVLTDEARASLLGSVQASTTLRLVLWGGGVGLGVLLLAGAAGFGLLTRRLRHLDAAVRGFDPAAPVADLPVPSRSRDELDALTHGFQGLAARVRAQVAALEDADRARRELVTNVSHDLRTPLTALRAALEATEDAPERSDLLVTARRNADRLTRQVQQLFDLSTLDGGDAPLTVEDFPLAELAHDVVHEFAARAAARGIALEVDVPHQLPLVRADLALVERALANLLDNAVRHARESGRVVVAATLAGDFVRVEVADDGPGLDPALHERVFERFFRADRARGGEGSGLGLAIVRRVAELHGGRVGVVSGPGTGARFWCTLPVAGGAPKPSGDPTLRA